MYTITTKTEFIPVSPVPFYFVSQCLPSCLPCLQNTFVDLEFSTYMYIYAANHSIHISNSEFKLTNFSISSHYILTLSIQCCLHSSLKALLRSKFVDL